MSVLQMCFSRLKFSEILDFLSMMPSTGKESSRIASTLLVIAIHEYRQVDGPGRGTGAYLTASESRNPRNMVPDFANFLFREFLPAVQYPDCKIARWRLWFSVNLFLHNEASSRSTHVGERTQSVRAAVRQRLVVSPISPRSTDEGTQRSSTTAGRPHTRIFPCCVNERSCGYMSE